jgi:8-oxo-dGTP pyrophosphatase MutT (NUDIX family)
MYEVFLNDRRIILADAGDADILNSPEKGEKASGFLDISTAIDKFLVNSEKTLLLYGDLKWLWPAFRSLFTRKPAAGGVVKSEKGYLFIFRRGCWDFPKGKIDDGETPEEAALREVKEETGLQDLTLTGDLPSTWHIYRSPDKKTKGQWILKETKWFMMSAEGNQPLSPEITEDIEEAKWFLLSEFNFILDNTYPNLKKLINVLQKT